MREKKERERKRKTQDINEILLFLSCHSAFGGALSSPGYPVQSVGNMQVRLSFTGFGDLVGQSLLIRKKKQLSLVPIIPKTSA